MSSPVGSRADLCEFYRHFPVLLYCSNVIGKFVIHRLSDFCRTLASKAMFVLAMAKPRFVRSSFRLPQTCVGGAAQKRR